MKTNVRAALPALAVIGVIEAREWGVVSIHLTYDPLDDLR